jgi:uncharacterized protein (TIGR03085 family)
MPGVTSRFAPRERHALADLLTELGPDAPTLCEGWTSRDLAAHLVVRGSRVHLLGGLFSPRLAGPLKRAQDRIARRDWPALVAAVRGRPWWAPGKLDEAANRVEYFIHHEDVRRAQPGWRPRPLPEDLARALWDSVPTRVRLALRRTPARVIVAAPGFGEIIGGKGGPEVRLTGDPGELLLFLFGRQAHAHVELTGPEHIVNRMRGAAYGI